jgi:chromosome segregation ATPase
MSQEEIEALMNGLDIVDDSDSEEETVAVNTQEIEELLSKTEEIKDDIKIEDEEIVKFDAIQEPVEFKTSVNNSDIEKLLNEIENASNDKKNLDEQEESILDSIECEAIQEKPIIVEKRLDRTEDEIVKDWTSSKINEGVFPLPAENDTKVVSILLNK